MTASLINVKQMKRLQTLWGMFARQANLDVKDRDARLDWVSRTVGRQISSCRELSVSEASVAINAIQQLLPPELVTRKRPSRETARAYGTAGRRGSDEKEVRLADAETWRLLDGLLAKLGWTRGRLDAFLRSSKSPVRSHAIRTLAEANRVIWSLKGMARRRERPALKSGSTANLGGNDAATLQRAG